MNKRRIPLALLLPCLAVFGVSSCNDNSSVVSEDSVFSISLESGAKSLYVGDSDKVVVSCLESYSYTYSSSDSGVFTVDGEGVLTPVAVGVATLTVTQVETGQVKTLELTVSEAELANGAYYYGESSYEEKSKILGKLEAYAVDNHLTGTTLFENGRLVMYNPRITKGSENYITGYGFGILSEGKITAPLAKEENDAWKNYYHSASSSDPASINALDTDGSQIADLYSYISSAYFDVKMNDTKDGYDWYPVLAKELPVCVNPSENGYGTTWKFRVRTGEDGLKYSTLSSKYAAYNGRGVELEDYVYAFKLLLNGKANYYRGSEMAGDTSNSAIVGASQYFNATKNVDLSDSEAIDAAFQSVAVVADPSDNSLTITLAGAVNQFYAMYYLASSLYQPVPKAFIDEVGVENYGNFVESSGDTPVDTILSLSPYTLEYWESNKVITFKRNADWFQFSDPELSSRYSIEGVHIEVVPAANEDSDALFNKFLNGELDSASIPTSHIKEYRNDPRTTSTTGDSTFKLNFNTCTEEQWIEKFGVNGSVAYTAEEDYWDVKPWMSNDAFIRGIEASLDRETFASNRGYVPSQSYFASAYMIDPEQGIPYNSTEDHANAIADNFPETYGYNLEAAKTLFSIAVNELVAKGQLVKGTVENPTRISIDTWWMYQSDIEDYGAEVSKYIEDAFNDPSVSGGTVVLKVNNYAVTNWIDVYYNHLMIGQFDIGFGSISGNTLDPLNFMEVLKSDNSSGFTLNWGGDTSVVSKDLVYDGKAWSFDALYDAADHGTVAQNGVSHPAGEFTVDYAASSISAVGIRLVIDYAWIDLENLETVLSDICLWVADPYYELIVAYYDVDPDYSDIVVDEENHTYTIEIGPGYAGLLEGYILYLYGMISDPTSWTYTGNYFCLEALGSLWGLSVYYYQSINGTVERYLSVQAGIEFPESDGCSVTNTLTNIHNI